MKCTLPDFFFHPENVDEGFVSNLVKWIYVFFNEGQYCDSFLGIWIIKTLLIHWASDNSHQMELKKQLEWVVKLTSIEKTVIPVD